MTGPARLTIAHATPYTWGSHDEVNALVANSAAELAERGHRVVIVAPGSGRREIQRTRAAIEGAGARRKAPFSGWDGESAGAGVPVLTVGQAIPMPRGPKPRAAPVPTNVSKTLEALFAQLDFDLVHVHDPFAPSLASATLRHSRSLNVGSFHEPTERILSTQVARPLVEIFFGRLDARIVSGQATGDLMRRFFPGTYVEVPGGADGGRRGGSRSRGGPRIVYCAREERGALRIMLRALRRLSLERDWEAAILLEDPSMGRPRLNRRLRERVHVIAAGEQGAEELIDTADVVCATSGGPRTAPSVIRQALAAAAVPVASHIDRYEEMVDEETGFLFPPGDDLTLAGQLERLISSERLRVDMARAAAAAARSWADVGDELERLYGDLVARRHDPDGDPAVRKRISRRPTIDCDLHMHTDHSNDCATPAEVLVETAKDRGMGAIAVTDHNEISGAFAARDYAEQVGGIKVIVGEEVKTAEQGEVIGLFLSEKIERGMTMAETIAEIRRQGGLVYVPHPFDRLHSVPDYEHLLEIVEEIDILEVFNPRVALSGFNEEAERFAAKYRIVPGAGSDGHVAQALGSVRIRMRDFDGPAEFLESMRNADIVRKHKNLVYVQALKQLQTAGGRGGGRRTVPSPRPVKGGKARPARR